MSDEGAGYGVHFFHGVIVLKDVIHPRGPGYGGHPVGNKIRCVLAQDHGLTQAAFPEFHHELGQFRIGLGGWDDFQQFQVAGRVEEMGSQEVGFEFIRAAFGNLPDRQTRGVGGNDTSRSPAFFYPGHDLVLNGQVLYNDLDDPVDFLDPVPVILHIPDGDQFQTGRAE